MASKSSERQEMNKILVLQTASIGDVVLATPLLEQLHAFYPEALLDVCVKKGNEGLFAHHPFLHRVFVWDKSKPKYVHFFQLANALRDQKYDLIVTLQRFSSAGFLTLYAGARQSVGFSKNPFSFFFSHRFPHRIGKDGQIHEVERNLSLLRPWIASPQGPIRLYPSAHDDAKMSQYKTHPYICIAPKSLWYTKQFPQEKWIEFLRRMDKNDQVYVMGGKSDKAYSDKIIEASGHPRILNLCGQLSYLESVCLMRDARMNFVNDSAPLHFASAVDAHVTAIFCSTVPAFGFGPRASDASVVDVGDTLSCRPCGLHGYNACPKSHFRCGKDIDVAHLLDRL